MNTEYNHKIEKWEKLEHYKLLRGICVLCNQIVIKPVNFKKGESKND